jgi:hypoxanthine phosphoribosyltransferase
MKTLISQSDLDRRVSQMAAEIDAYYKDKDWYRKTNEPVVIIGVLTGALFFMSDLIRKLTIRMELDFVRTSTYPGKSLTSREPKILVEPSRNLHDSHVLIVDDILDTGKTLKLIHDSLRWGYPKSMKTAVLLRKPDKAPENVKVDFIGFDIPDEFVVGYGLDYGGKHREMPCVAVWSEDESGKGENSFERNQSIYSS